MGETDESISRVIAGFKKSFGDHLEGVWSAPGRVNLIGEHSDYNEGLCLPFAINKRTHAAVGVGLEGVLRVRSASIRSEENFAEISLADLKSLFGDDSDPDSSKRQGLPHWATYPLGVAWALVQNLKDDEISSLPGLDLFFDSDIALGAGLSSSAAIECASAIALNDLWQLDLTKMQLAEACKKAENVAAGAPTGIMDQLASLYGSVGSAVLLDCQSMTVSNVPLDFARHGLTLAVIDTRVHHSNADGGFAERLAECNAAASLLGVRALRDSSLAELHEADISNRVLFGRARHVLTEIERVRKIVALLESDDVAEIGPILTEAHLSLRDDFDVSCAELNLAVAAALEAGALGARMVGAGFGGSAIALLSSEVLESFRESVSRAFSTNGYAQPNIFEAVPGPGAKRSC